MCLLVFVSVDFFVCICSLSFLLWILLFYSLILLFFSVVSLFLLVIYKFILKYLCTHRFRQLSKIFVISLCHSYSKICEYIHILMMRIHICKYIYAYTYTYRFQQLSKTPLSDPELSGIVVEICTVV